MFSFLQTETGFALSLDGREILRHSAEAPALFLGRGDEHITMHCGNFDIRDRLSARIPLRKFSVRQDGDEASVVFEDGELSCLLRLREADGLLHASFSAEDPQWNRFFLRLPAEPGEHVLGGGEQFSYFDLRGRTYPIWTREQGVGRNKKTEITFLSDRHDGSGGDYYTTFFPQPTFVSSRGYFAHLRSYCYAELDFEAPDFHEVRVWDTAPEFVFGAGDSYPALLSKLTALLGRQQPLPEWALHGIQLGIQGGTKAVTDLVERCRSGGMDVSAVWIQDWEGKRITSFGKRLQWDWRWNKELYPGLDRVIRDYAAQGIAFLGYINPYLVEGGLLFAEAEAQDFFVKDRAGRPYYFDFGEYNCGVVDLTNPAAFDWYKNVIRKNLIDLGFQGWMADFGEYLPADCVCFDGRSGLEAHNEWPVLWARCNRAAIRDSGNEGRLFVYFRSGAAGTQACAPMLWAGDQNVDFSIDDGLPSVITAALSVGMSGFGLHTCDCGGYTTLFHLHRTEEVLLRWLDFCCFTPVIRTHEGNRPDSNVQLYSTDELIAAGARISRLHTGLVPYLKACMEETAETGLPVMRSLCLRAPELAEAYHRELSEYLLGRDLLVAPVVEEGAKTRRGVLPDGEWVHFWTGDRFEGGVFEVPAPIGMTTAFYDPASPFAPLFRSLAEQFRLPADED